MNGSNDSSRGLGRRDLAWLVGIGVSTLGIWSVVTNRFSAEAWSVPDSYWGDAFFHLSYIKAYVAGDFGLFGLKVVPSLNAPFAANWNDYPVTEELLHYFAAGVAGIVGLFATMNVMVVLAHILAATAFYLAARLCGSNALFSAAGGLVIVGHRRRRG